MPSQFDSLKSVLSLKNFPLNRSRYCTLSHGPKTPLVACVLLTALICTRYACFWNLLITKYCRQEACARMNAWKKTASDTATRSFGQEGSGRRTYHMCLLSTLCTCSTMYKITSSMNWNCYAISEFAHIYASACQQASAVVVVLMKMCFSCRQPFCEAF